MDETVLLVVVLQKLRSCPQIDIQVIVDMLEPLLPAHLQQTEYLVGIGSRIAKMREGKPTFLIDLVFDHHLNGDLFK